MKWLPETRILRFGILLFGFFLIHFGLSEACAGQMIPGILVEPRTMLHESWEKMVDQLMQVKDAETAGNTIKTLLSNRDVKRHPKWQGWVKSAISALGFRHFGQEAWTEIFFQKEWQDLYRPLLNGKEPTPENIIEYIQNK